MRAAIYQSAGEVVVEDVPDAALRDPTNAVVAATGLHGAVLSGVDEGSTVAVIGDGAVGLCAGLGATKVLGAEQVILMSQHPDRTAVGKEFGATVVPERGEEGIERVRELTGGLGVRHVVEAVGTPEAWDMAIGMARDGGRIGAVGVPHTTPQLGIFTPFRQHLTLSLGIAPVRHYLPDLVGRVLAGGYDPGRAFDLSLSLEQVAEGYLAMSERRSIKTAGLFHAAADRTARHLDGAVPQRRHRRDGCLAAWRAAGGREDRDHHRRLPTAALPDLPRRGAAEGEISE
jgi:threonine dehydrogenase-like Zn-dependent dehydrogenase